MYCLLVRFRVLDDVAARRFDQLTAEAFQAHEHAPHVIDFHARKAGLLDGPADVEVLTLGPLKGRAPSPAGS